MQRVCSPAMTSYQWENDEWHPIVGIPFSDRGFRHGFSAFETLRIHQGKLVFCLEHLAKLRQATAVMGLREIPENLGRTLESRRFDFSQGIARIYVTAGDGDLNAPGANGRIVMLVEEKPRKAAAGIRLRMHPTFVSLTWPSLKTGNYGAHLAAHREACSAGYDEAVLVNPAKHVISAATGNLFARIDGMLMTPRIASGARAGVIRDWVLTQSEVVVCDFHPEQLEAATEIFVTNSGVGIGRVTQLGGREFTCHDTANDLTNIYARMLEEH